MARRAARGLYEGPPERETHVAVQLHELRSILSRLFRTDEELHDAQANLALCSRRLQDATNRLPRVNGLTEQRVALALDVDVHDETPDSRARWTDGALARSERKDAERAVEVARRAEMEADGDLRTAERRSIDVLTVAATAGLVPINGYLAAFDQARAYEGREGIGLLGEEMVRQLVRETVRPVRVDDPESDTQREAN